MTNDAMQLSPKAIEFLDFYAQKLGTLKGKKARTLTFRWPTFFSIDNFVRSTTF
jgi:hypothetical protein